MWNLFGYPLDYIAKFRDIQLELVTFKIDGEGKGQC